MEITWCDLKCLIEVQGYSIGSLRRLYLRYLNEIYFYRRHSLKI